MIDFWVRHRKAVGDDKVYRAVAEAIRARALSPEDAEVLAGWFDRLAAGEDPAKIFAKAAGRPRGSTKQRKRKVDDLDIAWIHRDLVERNVKPGAADKGIAKALGMKEGTVRNIRTRLRSELAPK